MSANVKMSSINNSTTALKISRRFLVFIAGGGFLMSFAGAIFAAFYVDIEKLAANPNSIMVGIFGYIIAILGDIIRAWALYVFFQQTNKNLAIASAWFMLVHDAIFGAALINLALSSALFSSADYLAVLTPGQLEALSALFFSIFNYGFQIGLFFFSFHLGLLGYLVYKSGYIPKILGVLLFVASFGYLVNSGGIIVSPEFPEIFWTIFMGPCLLGELALVLWLVVKGGKEPTK